MKKNDSDQCLLKWVEQQEKAAMQFGFYWERIDQLMEQIRSECNEVEEAWQKDDRTHLQEELGDLIQATISLAIFCKFDPSQTLKKAIEKFQKRYDAVVALAKSDGYETLHGKSFEELMKYWNLAKKQ